MIVQPELLTHPKFTQLRSRLGLITCEVLLKLWAHCHTKRGEWWAGADLPYVEYVVTGRTKTTTTACALRDCGWIHVEEGGIRVHDFNENNATVVLNWTRNKIWRESRLASLDKSADTSTPHPQTPSPDGSTDPSPDGSYRIEPNRTELNGSITKGEPPGNAQAALAQRAQFAALSSLIERDETVGFEALGCEGRERLRKNRARLLVLQEKQAIGATP